jgi:hypothetical protein
MQIKSPVKYSYNPLALIKNEPPFKAEITLLLPKAPDKDCINPCFYGKIESLEINEKTGISEKDSEFIKVEKIFYSESIERLNERIKSEIEKYRQQVLKNTENIQKAKKVREITLVFHDTKTINFSVKYSYEGEICGKPRFSAILSVLFPKAPGKDHIDPCFFGEIGGWLISDKYVDKSDSKFVKVEIYTCADGSIEELDKDIDQNIEKYRQKVLTNIENIQKTKEEMEIILDLPNINL